MSYTITLTEPAHEMPEGSDTYSLILTLTVDDTASNESYNFSEKSINILDAGEFELEYDLDDPLLVPGTITISLHDGVGYLHSLLFENALIEPSFKVEIKINGTNEFVGYSIVDSIDSNAIHELNSVYEIIFTALPRTDVLNRTRVYDENGLHRDPLNYTEYSARAISNATHSSGTVTVTHASASEFVTGMNVKIDSVAGMTDLNGYWEVTNVSSTQFTIELDTDQTYSSGGNVTALDFQAGNGLQDFVDVLDDCFQLINASISISGGEIDVDHNWVFSEQPQTTPKKLNVTNATHAAGVVTVTHDSTSIYDAGSEVIIEDVVGMTDLNGQFTVVTEISNTQFTVSLTTAQSYTSGGTVWRLNSTDFDSGDLHVRIGTLFFQNHIPNQVSNLAKISSVADVLKKVAFDAFAFAGVIHEEKAFFKKLFYFNDSNKFTLTNVLSRKYKYKYGIVKYVKVHPLFSDTKKWEAGTHTNKEEESILIDDAYWTTWQDGIISNSVYFPTGNNIWKIKDTDYDNSYDGWYDINEVVANLWFNNRGNVLNNRIEVFEVRGVDFDFLKSMQYDGGNYQIIKLARNFSTYTSTIEAIYLGASS